MDKGIIVGVYKITNNLNNKFYIGSSNNIYRRWKEHINDLNKNKHINNHLQYSWNKYGEDNFKFEILEECEEDIRIQIEQKYLDNLTPFKEIGYNISPVASNCVLGGEENGWFGKGYLQTGNQNVFYGKKHTKESRRLISENHANVMGENHPLAYLKNEEVIKIKEQLAKGKMLYDELSVQYKCPKVCIKNIAYLNTYVLIGEQYNKELSNIYKKIDMEKLNEIRDSIIDLYFNKNIEIKEIYNIMDYDRHKISRIIRTEKINRELYEIKPRMPEEDRLKRNNIIVDLFLKGMIKAEIVRQTGYTKKVVEKAVKKYYEQLNIII